MIWFFSCINCFRIRATGWVDKMGWKNFLILTMHNCQSRSNVTQLTRKTIACTKSILKSSSIIHLDLPVIWGRGRKRNRSEQHTYIHILLAATEEKLRRNKEMGGEISLHIFNIQISKAAATVGWEKFALNLKSINTFFLKFQSMNVIHILFADWQWSLQFGSFQLSFWVQMGTPLEFELSAVSTKNLKNHICFKRRPY